MGPSLPTVRHRASVGGILGGGAMGGGTGVNPRGPDKRAVKGGAVSVRRSTGAAAFTAGTPARHWERPPPRRPQATAPARHCRRLREHGRATRGEWLSLMRGGAGRWGRTAGAMPAGRGTAHLAARRPVATLRRRGGRRGGAAAAGRRPGDSARMHEEGSGAGGPRPSARTDPWARRPTGLGEWGPAAEEPSPRCAPLQRSRSMEGTSPPFLSYNSRGAPPRGPAAAAAHFWHLVSCRQCEREPHFCVHCSPSKGRRLRREWTGRRHDQPLLRSLRSVLGGGIGVNASGMGRRGYADRTREEKGGGGRSADRVHTGAALRGGFPWDGVGLPSAAGGGAASGSCAEVAAAQSAAVAPPGIARY